VPCEICSLPHLGVELGGPACTAHAPAPARQSATLAKNQSWIFNFAGTGRANRWRRRAGHAMPCWAPTSPLRRTTGQISRGGQLDPDYKQGW